MAPLGVRIPINNNGDGVSSPIEPRVGFRYIVRGFGAEAPQGSGGGIVFSHTPDSGSPQIVEELAELTSVTFPSPLVIDARQPIYIVVMDASAFGSEVQLTLDYEVQSV